MSDDLQRLLGDLIARVTNLEKDNAGDRITRLEGKTDNNTKAVRWLLGLVASGGGLLFTFFARQQGWF